MKSVKYVAIGIAVVLGLAGTIVNADAKELTITGSFPEPLPRWGSTQIMMVRLSF